MGGDGGGEEVLGLEVHLAGAGVDLQLEVLEDGV